jgi:hypothetical protein
MQWLVTPPHYRNPPTRAELAAEIGVSLRTLQLWMSRADFRDDWREEAEEVIGDENRAKHVLDVLYQAAIDPNNRQQVQAAKLYLEATKAIQPTTKVEVVRPKDLTDEELDAMLAENAAIAKAEHQLDSSVADGD